VIVRSRIIRPSMAVASLVRLDLGAISSPHTLLPAQGSHCGPQPHWVEPWHEQWRFLIVARDDRGLTSASGTRRRASAPCCGPNAAFDGVRVRIVLAPFRPAPRPLIRECRTLGAQAQA
jgi:hypothetical protein